LLGSGEGGSRYTIRLARANITVDVSKGKLHPNGQMKVQLTAQKTVNERGRGKKKTEEKKAGVLGCRALGGREWSLFVRGTTL